MKLQDKDFIKNKYEDIKDEELISMLRDGAGEITDYLMDKYKPLVKSKARSMYILGADTEDLIQEGMIGLFKAIRDYDSGRDASFFTFADLCVSRQMYTAVTASARKKHAPLNSYVSLSPGASEHNGDAGEDASSALYKIASTIDENPESLVIDQENVKIIKGWMETELSSFERETLELFLTGMNYTEIARVLAKDEKSTDNALQRAKSKIKKLLEKNR